MVDELPEEIQPFLRDAAEASPAAPPPEDWGDTLCNDMTADQRDHVLARLVAEPWGPMFEPVSLAGFGRGIPSTWVRLGQDLVATPEDQDRRRVRAGVDHVVELDAGHDVMVSRPDALAEVLNAAFASAQRR